MAKVVKNVETSVRRSNIILLSAKKIAKTESIENEELRIN